MSEIIDLKLTSPFPPAITFIAMRGTIDACLTLSLPESNLINKRAAPIRRAQFALGRYTARKALESIDAPNSLIGRLPNGAPQWPTTSDGTWIGSISHTVVESSHQPASAVAGVAIGAPGIALAVGLDIEARTRRLNPDTARKIATESERSWIKPNSEDLLILACAKEALYKAYSPLYGSVFIGFQNADLAFDRQRETLTGTLTVPKGPTIQVSIKIALSEGLIVAGTFVVPPN